MDIEKTASLNMQIQGHVLAHLQCRIFFPSQYSDFIVVIDGRE